MQRDVKQRGGHRVTAASDVTQLVDQVEKRKQHEERCENQQRRQQNFAADVALERAHYVAGCGRRARPKRPIPET